MNYELYTNPQFWLVLILIVGLTIPPVLFIKHGRQIFYPRLINLVMSQQIDQTIDIEDKLKIDIVKLGKDLDSLSSES